MQSQFKHLKFKTDKELQKWLLKNSYRAIYLQSLGQDMEKIQIHKSGEILDTDFHSKLYVGKFINVDALRVDVPLQIWNDDESNWTIYSRLIPEEIIHDSI